MKTLRYILAVMIFVISGISADAQVDKKDVRRGNRDFRKENYREADIDYRKALLKDSTSVAANYNLASVLYRQGDMQQAATTLDRIKETAPATESSADYWYNRGDVALGMKDYQTAVDAFAKSLMIRPEDMEAKENFIYAKKMLENQQNQDQNQQNQNQNQNDDQNKDQNQDQNQNNDQNNDQNQNDDQDKNQDQNKQNQDQNDDRQNQDKKNQQGQEPKLSPQAAQQMLQAIQAKEKETQEKVKEEKAKALKSRQKEKNW